MNEDEVRKKILEEERIRRNDPKWVPMLLNGASDFEKKVKERLKK